MTVEQRRVLLYLDALRLYWVGFEGRAVSRRDIFADADLAARFHADRANSIDYLLGLKGGARPEPQPFQPAGPDSGGGGGARPEPAPFQTAAPDGGGGGGDARPEPAVTGA